MNRLLAALLAALTLLSLTACGDTSPAKEPEPEAPPIEEPAPPPTEPDPLEELLSSMTLEEKVGQLFFVRCPAENAIEDVNAYHLGGYILFGRDTKDKTANELIQTIQSYQDAARPLSRARTTPSSTATTWAPAPRVSCSWAAARTTATPTATLPSSLRTYRP